MPPILLNLDALRYIFGTQGHIWGSNYLFGLVIIEKGWGGMQWTRNEDEHARAQDEEDHACVGAASGLAGSGRVLVGGLGQHTSRTGAAVEGLGSYAALWGVRCGVRCPMGVRCPVGSQTAGSGWAKPG